MREREPVIKYRFSLDNLENGYFEKIKMFSCVGDDFYQKLKATVENSKEKNAKMCFWLDRNFRNRLLRQYNLREK